MNLVIGASSYIGRHYLKKNREAIGLSRSSLDLLDPHLRNIPSHTTHAIITAGITNIGTCEENPTQTYACNVNGTLKLATLLLEKGITPILFSTDYVFNGLLDTYVEEDLTSPLNHYGRQKAIMEAQAPKGSLILRLSKVYGFWDNTLLDQMVNAFSKGLEIKAAKDQIFSPIHIEDVIDAIDLLIKDNCQGLYNLAGAEALPRADLARRIAKRFHKEHLVKEIVLADLEENFIRPKKTVLNTDKIKNQIKLSFRSIDTSIKQYGTH